MAKNKVKVPKRIGGVKIPKAIRKAPLVTTLLNDPLGREVLAGALAAGAGAATAALARHHPNVAQMQGAGEASASSGDKADSDVENAVRDAAGAFASMMAEAARHVVPEDAKAQRKGKGLRPVQ